MGSKVKAPTPRNYLQEMQSSLNAQAGIQGQLLAQDAYWTPLWQQQQSKNLQTGMEYLSQNYEQQIPRSAQISQQYAQAMAPAFGAIGESARTAYQQTLDPSVRGILGTLGQQAQEGLTLGSALSQAEINQAQQAARAAMTSRGMQSGNQAVALEVLNTYNMGKAREAQRQQLASSVYGMGQNAAQQAMGLYGGNMLGFAQGVSPISSYQMATGINQGLGSSLFQPESQYNAQLITANRQEQMQAQLANKQASAGLMGGLLGATGSIIGGMASGGTGFFKK